jgi:hypothetical protein
VNPGTIRRHFRYQRGGEGIARYETLILTGGRDGYEDTETFA